MSSSPTFSGSAELEESTRALFATDPAEFVGTRNRMTRERRAAGDKEIAAALAKLRRPPIPVWALNRVARDSPDAVELLASAADAARRAQERAVTGTDASALRDANAALRRAIDDVARAALAVVNASGRSADAYARDVDRVVAAVAGSDRLLGALRRGLLGEVDAETEDVFARLAESVGAVDEPPRSRSRATSGAAAKKRARAQERLTEHREAADAAHDDLARAEHDLEVARTRYERARRTADRADRAAAESEAALARLEDES